MKKQNNPEARKLLINSKIDQVNNEEISLEGFFDFLFGKKKEAEVKRDLVAILEHVESNTDIKIKSQYKDFDDYIKTLKDLVENVLTDYVKNIDRVTKFLTFFLQHREKVINFKTELEKLGDFKISVVTIKGKTLYKTRYNSSRVSFWNIADHVDNEGLSKEQLAFLKFPEYLIDIDVLFSVNISASEKSEISLDETQRKALQETLIELEKKLPAIKEKGQELQELFLKSEKVYKEVLKHLSFSEEVIEDEYVGFGGSMYQGLGYLYEIKHGIEANLDKEIK